MLLKSALSSQGMCTELPVNRELETDTTFPIKNGVEVVVRCKTGYTLTSGDRVLTCETDDRYTFQDSLPVCSIGGEFFLFTHFSLDLIP